MSTPKRKQLLAFFISMCYVIKMNKLQKWLLAATPEEKAKLAELAGMSVAVLRQIAGAYRTKGQLRTTPETARELELAARKIARKGLPELLRENLCPACQQCEYRKGCK